MKAADYNTKYGVAGGKVKVLPTTIQSKPVFPKSPTFTQKVIVENGSSTQTPMFRLPPPPKKTAPANANATLINVQHKPLPQEINLKHPTSHFSNGFTTQYKNSSPTSPAFVENHSPIHSLPPPSRQQIPRSTTSGDKRVNESDGVLTDMKKLQYELAQLKLELASITEPMKEHDEWLKVQSEQVKELVEQQKTLHSSIISNGHQPTAKVMKYSSLPPTPFKHVKASAEKISVPKGNSFHESVTGDQRKVPMIEKVPEFRGQESSKKLIPAEQDIITTGLHNKTVNVRRISGIFEKNISSNEKMEIPQNVRPHRISVADDFKIDKSQASNALSRSKSMYNLKKPPPSPKPNFKFPEKEQSFVFNATRERIANFHNTHQSSTMPPHEKSVTSTSSNSKPVAKESLTSTSSTSTINRAPLVLPPLPKRPTSSPQPRAILQTIDSNAESSRETLVNGNSKNPLLTPKNVELAFEKRETLRPLVKPPQHSNLNKSPNNPPPPPPLPSLVVNNSDTNLEKRSSNSAIIMSHESQPEIKNGSHNNTPPFTPPGTLNLSSPKADLLQQIRDFSNSGKTLKKASSVSSDGGTPQSQKKDVMHDALQTRFKAFCGNESDSSESEEDEDWED